MQYITQNSIIKDVKDTHSSIYDLLELNIWIMTVTNNRPILNIRYRDASKITNTGNIATMIIYRESTTRTIYRERQVEKNQSRKKTFGEKTRRGKQVEKNMSRKICREKKHIEKKKCREKTFRELSRFVILVNVSFDKEDYQLTCQVHLELEGTQQYYQRDLIAHVNPEDQVTWSRDAALFAQ